MPGPPPKQNAWVQQSSSRPVGSQGSDTEQQPPVGGGVVPAQPSKKGPNMERWKLSMWNECPKGQSGTSSCGAGDKGRKTTGRNHIGMMAKEVKCPNLNLRQRTWRKSGLQVQFCKQVCCSLRWWWRWEWRRRLHGIDLYMLCLFLVSHHPGTFESKSSLYPEKIK